MVPSQMKRMAVILVAASSMVFAADSSRCLQSPAANVRVTAMADDFSAMTVSDTGKISYSEQGTVKAEDCTRSSMNLAIVGTDLRNTLKTMQVKPGAHLKISFDKAGGKLTDVSYATIETSTTARIALLVIAPVLLFVLAIVLTRGHPLKLVINEDKRFSNSKIQSAIWFWILVSTYAALLILRRVYGGPEFVGGISIPTNLLLISGVSAITYAGAKGITVAKINTAQRTGTNPDPKNFLNAAAPAAPVPAPRDRAAAINQVGAEEGIAVAAPPALPQRPAISRATPSLLHDLMTDDYGDFDFGDFQMIIVMLVAVATYVLVIFEFMGHVELRTGASLPDLDTTILSAFGLGQGAYLAKKAVGDVGRT